MVTARQMLTVLHPRLLACDFNRNSIELENSLQHLFCYVHIGSIGEWMDFLRMSITMAAACIPPGVRPGAARIGVRLSDFCGIQLTSFSNDSPTNDVS